MSFDLRAEIIKTVVVGGDALDGEARPFVVEIGREEGGLDATHPEQTGLRRTAIVAIVVGAFAAIWANWTRTNDVVSGVSLRH